MENNMISIKLGREEGKTEFHGNDPVTSTHYFRFFEDPRTVPYGERCIVALRQISENGNKRDSVIKVLGTFGKGEYSIKKDSVEVPITKDMIVRGFDLKEDIERQIRKAYKTEEKVDFSC
ncbi:MAG: hypothetical protein V1678_03760 [Candidatus Aenigmatarchaeota archaeon]